MNKSTRQKFNSVINSGFVYMNNVHKTYEDYIKNTCDEFEIITPEAVKYIVRYGLMQIFHIINKGVSFHFESKLSDVAIFAGKKTKNYMIEFANLYKYKVRYLASKGHIQHDGYYYFILSEEQNKIFNETGKINTFLFRYKEEIYSFISGEYIYKTTADEKFKAKIYVTEHEKAKSEYISRRDKFRFKSNVDAEHDIE